METLDEGREHYTADDVVGIAQQYHEVRKLYAQITQMAEQGVHGYPVLAKLVGRQIGEMIPELERRCGPHLMVAFRNELEQIASECKALAEAL